jgi:hypothetical protein
MKTTNILASSLLALSLGFPALVQAQDKPAPSPFAGGGSQPAAEQSAPAAPKKLAPIAESPPAAAPQAPAVAPAPAAASTGSTASADDKDRIIEELRKEIEALKAVKGAAPAAASTEAKAEAKPTDKRKMADGWVVRIVPAMRTGDTEDEYVIEQDPLGGFELNAHALPYTKNFKGVKFAAGKKVALQAQGFLRVTESGRHSFVSTIEQKSWPRDQYGSMGCKTVIGINGERIAGAIGFVGNESAAGKTVTASGGVELEPGLYKIEWTSYCDGQLKLVEGTNLNFAIKTPSALAPEAPKPGTIVHEVK